MNPPNELKWRKATFSNGQGNCVEVAPLPSDGVAVRDSKNPDGPTLAFRSEEWTAFLEGVKGGEFSLEAIHGRS